MCYLLRDLSVFCNEFLVANDAPFADKTAISEELSGIAAIDGLIR